MVDIVGSQTLCDMWDEAVRLVPDRDFLVFLHDDGWRAQYSYRQFDDWVAHVVELLAQKGIAKGTMVAMQLGNCPEFVAVLLGLAKLGAVAVPVGVKTPPAEALRLYRASEATWSVVESGLVAEHARLHDTEGVLAGGVIDVSEVTRVKPQPGDARPPARHVDVSSDDLAEVMFTSGTTATPKGVCVTHANMVYSGLFTVWQTSLRAQDRIFTTMSACHSNFQLVAMTGAIAAGAAVILTNRYHATTFWRTVREERATVVQLTAVIARTMLVQPLDSNDANHDVRVALYYMPLADAERDAFQQRFAVEFLNSYGSTESICWVVTDPPTGERRWPSVGRAAISYEVAITDPDGNEMPPGEAGEFRIKGVPGRTLMAGYLNDPDSTAEALTPDGWLRTSDIGYCDKDGWFYFIDRSHNIIKRAGENISATEVEVVLASHPLIREAAVIGVPDPVRDQAVKAVVALEPGATLSEDEIAQYCAERLAPFKVPSIIEYVAALPRSASMKIAKRALLNGNIQQ